MGPIRVNSLEVYVNARQAFIDVVVAVTAPLPPAQHTVTKRSRGKHNVKMLSHVVPARVPVEISNLEVCATVCQRK